jgi:hypothetical protein
MNSHMSNMTLDMIKEGMAVYDRTGDRIGTVEVIQFGDENPNTPGAETATTAGYDRTQESGFVQDLARAFAGDDNIPEPIRARMLRHGYVRVDTGILSGDVFFMPDQINAISEDSVSLAVTKGELTRL